MSPPGESEPAARTAELRGIGALLPRDRAGETLVLRHAEAVAAALGQPLTIARVIDPIPSGAPADPVDWHLRALELRTELEGIKASEAPRTQLDIRVAVLDGYQARHLPRWAASQALDLLVLSTSDHEWAGLLLRPSASERAPSLLAVPAATYGDASPRYARILVPLDGSVRAESALPLAIRLAHVHDAELLLVHAVPPLELTGVEPLSSDDLDLRQRVRRRNEGVARAYLERVHAHVGDAGRCARIIVAGDGDVRRHLTDVITREQADLVVLCAHGHGGSDDTCGSVAAYLIAHGTVPLIVRQDVPCREWPSGAPQVPIDAAPHRGVAHEPL